MKTTKQHIFNRLMNDNTGNTAADAQWFVDEMFPNTPMDVIVETDDEDMDDEVSGNVGDTAITANWND